MSLILESLPKIAAEVAGAWAPFHTFTERNELKKGEDFTLLASSFSFPLSPLFCFAAPLGQIKEIVVLGGSGDSVSGEITRLVGSLPPAVQALTGVDITNVSARPSFVSFCSLALLHNRP